MSKNFKKILGVIVTLVIIFAIIWLGYEAIKPETVSISATNELPNENMGLDNIINDLFESETSNTTSNEIVNEVSNEISNEIANAVETSEATENDEEKSEVITGTNTSREERAIELATEYYKEEYGNTDEIYFSCEEIYSDGRYIIRAGNADSGKNMFLFVNLDTGIVTEK